MPFDGAQILYAIEKPGVASCAHFSVTVLAYFARFHLAAKLLRHGLHAVADAKHRDAQLEDRARRFLGRRLVGRHVTAGKNDPLGAVLADKIVANIARVNFAVGARFSHAAGDQLRVLRAEVENENFFVVHGTREPSAVRHRHPQSPTVYRLQDYSIR